MLSEKAQGKKRAIDPPASSTQLTQPLEAQSEALTARNLIIRFTDGLPDLVLQVHQKDTVVDVKNRVRDARPQLKDRRLRLIHSGRLLADEIAIHVWLESLQKKRASSDANIDGNLDSTVMPITWLHCSVGAKMEIGEEDFDDGKAQTTQLQPARGFDRLASAGFSETDIANFRREFHSQSSSNYLDTDFDTEEEYDEHARALEEQWIDSMDNAGTASLSQSSASNSTILEGILLGFFFPLLPFFFMRRPKPAVFWEDGSEYELGGSVVFSKRMQMGLVMGFLVNVLFGLWRFLLDAS